MKWNTVRVENPPPGNHVGRCISLIDLGTQQHPGFQGGQPWNSRDVRIVFELPGLVMQGLYKPELKGKTFRVSTTVKQSLHPSAKLRKFLESWRGKKFSNDDIEKFDPKSIVGRGCRLTLLEGNGYVNVDGISPLAAGDKLPKPIYAPIILSLEADEYDPKVYAQLPKQLRNKIAASPEFRALVGGADGEHDPGPEEFDNPPEDDSSNIPF